MAAFAVPAAHPPAVALIVTCGAALAAVAVISGASPGVRRALATIGLVGLLAIPAATSVRLVQAHSSDGGNPGGMPLSAVARLSDYLAAIGTGRGTRSPPRQRRRRGR